MLKFLNIKSLFLIAILSALAEGASNEAAKVIDPVTRFKNLITYGTYQQQVEALVTLDRSGLLKTNRQPYEEALSILVAQTDNVDVIKKLMELICNYQLVGYNSYLEKVVLDRDSRGADLGSEDLSLLAEGLRRMNQISNLAFTPVLRDFATNRIKHRDNPQILSEALRGMEIHKIGEMREPVRSYLKNDDTHEAVQVAALRVIAAFKNEEDLEFIQGVAKNPDQRSMVRWIAIVALGDYAPNEKAFDYLKQYYQSTDIEIKSRALYALRVFKKEEVKELLIKATRDNSPRLRGYAIKALADWNDESINTLLEFKAKNETEAGIKTEAIKILKDRNLWKEEEKKK